MIRSARGEKIDTNFHKSNRSTNEIQCPACFAFRPIYLPAESSRSHGVARSGEARRGAVQCNIVSGEIQREKRDFVRGAAAARGRSPPSPWKSSDDRRLRQRICYTFSTDSHRFHTPTTGSLFLQLQLSLHARASGVRPARPFAYTRYRINLPSISTELRNAQRLSAS